MGRALGCRGDGGLVLAPVRVRAGRDRLGAAPQCPDLERPDALPGSERNCRLLALVPVVMLGVARGAWMVGSARRPAVPVAAFALFGVLMTAPALETYQEFRRPLRYEQLAPVLDRIRGEWQPGDRMYVYYGA